MMQPIKIAVRCLFSQAFPLQFYPEMTTTELTEFVLNCQILHQAKEEDGAINVPIRLVSLTSSPLLDYMLMSPHITIGQVYSVYKYIKTKEDLSLFYLKQSQFQRHQYYHKSLPLQIGVYYQPKITLDAHEKMIYSYQIVGQDDESYRHMNHITHESLNGQLFSISHAIQLNSATSDFTVSRSISKADLNSFQKLETIFLMRKKLIEFNSENIHLFGQLKQISQDKQMINFFFEYIPYVSFSDMMHFQFSMATISYLVNKIWIFLLHLMKNGFESYIYKLFKKRALKELFDCIGLCINHRLIITNINIVLQYGFNQRFSPAQHEELIQEIKIYIKLNKSQLTKYEDRIQIDQSSAIHPISIFSFSKIFLTKKYRHHAATRVQYQPKTNLLLWKPDPSTPQNEKKANINEVSTTKKVRDQPKNQDDKKPSKKDQVGFLNRSRPHESIKKTKSKRMHH